MNAKLIFKTIFLIALALLLVIMGMNNTIKVALYLPGILPKSFTQPAAVMYIGFFGLGLITGTILTAGGKKGGGSGGAGGSGKSKSA